MINSKIMRTIHIKRRPSFMRWVLFLTLFGALLSYYLSGLESHKFHRDEYHFLKKSYYFDLFFIKKDFQDLRWYIRGAPDQPKVGPYIYGSALKLYGAKDADKYLQSIGFNNLKVGGENWWAYYWSKRLVDVPSPLVPALNIVWLGRRVSVLFAFAGLSLLYFIALRTKNVLFALVATGLLGINSLMFSYSSRAMTDSMQLFFFLNNLLLSLIYSKTLKDGESKKSIFLSFALGLNLAFGVGVKISGILMLLYLAVMYFMLLTLYRKSKSMIKNVVFGMVVTFSSFLLIFTALHPYLYRNPVRNFISMFTNRMEVAEEYQVEYPSSAIYTREGAMKAIANRTLFPGGDYTNFKLGSFPADLLLFAIGLFLMAKKAMLKLKIQEISGELLLTLWTIVVMVSLVLYLKNSWPRYFLPIVSVIVITQAYAITAILQTIWAPLKKY